MLRTPHLKLPARLSKEVMSCMGFGGVKSEVLESLFSEGLHTEYKKLADWEGDGAMVKLWDAVCDAEHVVGMRLRREAAGASRAFGYGEDKGDETIAALHLNEDDEDGDRSVAWAPDLISGQPSALGETVLSLLEAGFQPQTNPVLAGKLIAIIGTAVNNFVERYKVGVPLSAEGFAVPGM